MINNIHHWLVTCFVPFTLYMIPKNPRHPEKLNNFSKVHGKYMEELGFQLPEGRRVRGQESVQFEFVPLSRNFPIVSTYISLTRICHGADSILKEIWEMWLLWSLSLTPQNTQDMKMGTEVMVPTSSVWLTDQKNPKKQNKRDTSERKPPVDHKHNSGFICQRILFEEPATWPTTWVLLVILGPGASPHYTSASSGWPFLCNSGRAGEQQGFTDIPNPMQFTCYVAMKVVVLVIYCCITGYLKT